MENENSEQVSVVNKNKKIYSILLNIVLVLAIVILLVRVSLLVFFTNIYVTGPSMFPNLKQWEAGYTRKIFDYEDIDRFDIIVIDAERFSTKDSHWVKRVIALPGETLSYEIDEVNKKGILKINGEIIEEDFIQGYEGFSKDNITYLTGVIDELTLGDDEYFFMGDNRGHSTDSRERGPVKEDEIIGLGIIITGECKDNTCSSIRSKGIRVEGW